jgi:hypothetical protein
LLIGIILGVGLLIIFYIVKKGKDFFGDFFSNLIKLPKQIALKIWSITEWFLSATGLIRFFEDFINLYQNLSAADVVSFWKQVGWFVSYFLVFDGRFLYTAKCFYYDYYQVRF